MRETYRPAGLATDTCDYSFFRFISFIFNLFFFVFGFAFFAKCDVSRLFDDNCKDHMRLPDIFG